MVTNGATEAEAAEAEVAETHATERMTTVLRDSNRMKCSAVKSTCCGRTTGALPSCGCQKIATEAEAAEAEADEADATERTATVIHRCIRQYNAVKVVTTKRSVNGKPRSPCRQESPSKDRAIEGRDRATLIYWRSARSDFFYLYMPRIEHKQDQRKRQ